MKEWMRLWFQVWLIAIVGIFSIWIASPWHPTIKLGSFYRDLNIKLGLDLRGGVHLVYRANTTGLSAEEVPDALAGVRDVIERRINAFGVSEPVVQTNRVGEEQRVIVELAGINDPQQAIAQIGATPQLDFRREVSQEEATEQFNLDDTTEITGPVFERTKLTGKYLKRSTVVFDQVTGIPEVNLEFNDEGRDIFAELTRENLNKRLAIYLDEVPISAPVVQSEITNGQAVISGGFTVQEAKSLVQSLNAGALPVPIELIGQQAVGPSLGQRYIVQSLEAGVVGFLAVVLWMIIFYRMPGVVASLALVIYVAVFLVLIKVVPITLTLAGIAGFILSIGMAVDANVLIFERFRENVRAGKDVMFSMNEGFKEAWDSIVASNVSGLITAIILYAFGTSLIRGFAVTLAIGIGLSMLTAVVLTKPFLKLWLMSRISRWPWLLSVKPVAGGNHD